jgi:hypothetical protein
MGKTIVCEPRQILFGAPSDSVEESRFLGKVRHDDGEPGLEHPADQAFSEAVYAPLFLFHRETIGLFYL